MERRPDTIVIRSFRVVFDLGLRRLFKVDRFRVPFPYGLPLRGVAYWAATLLVLLVLLRLPGTGDVVAALPPPVRYLLLPSGRHISTRSAPCSTRAASPGLRPTSVCAWRARRGRSRTG